MSLILDGTTEVLRAKLDAAPATTNPTFFFSYGDDGASLLLAKKKGDLNGTTPVVVVDAPAADTSRVVHSGFIYNGDTADVILTLESYDGTTARTLSKKTVASGATFVFGDEAFSVAANEASSVYDWVIALGDETTAITTGTKVTMRALRPMTLAAIRASLTTAGSTASEFDVKLNGVSLFSTTLTIDATEKTSETAATPSVLSTTAIAVDDELTFIIITAGTDAAGPKIGLVAAT